MNVGDSISFEELVGYTALPAGTVLIPDDGSQPRVIADVTKGDNIHLFTDKSGFIGVKQFTVAHIPVDEVAALVETLALELHNSGAGIKALSVEDIPVSEAARRRARYVLDNFVRKDSLILVGITDDADDTWELDSDTGIFRGVTHDWLFFSEEEIARFYGIKDRRYESS